MVRNANIFNYRDKLTLTHWNGADCWVNNLVMLSSDLQKVVFFFININFISLQKQYSLYLYFQYQPYDSLHQALFNHLVSKTKKFGITWILHRTKTSAMGMNSCNLEESRSCSLSQCIILKTFNVAVKIATM